jgi:hypothetical protein
LVTELEDELATELFTLLAELLTELFELVAELGTLLTTGLLDDDCTGAELLELVVRAIEHSFTPPAIRAPNTASEHTKLPDNNL